MNEAGNSTPERYVEINREVYTNDGEQNEQLVGVTPDGEREYLDWNDMDNIAAEHGHGLGDTPAAAATREQRAALRGETSQDNEPVAPSQSKAKALREKADNLHKVAKVVNAELQYPQPGDADKSDNQKGNVTRARQVARIAHQVEQAATAFDGQISNPQRSLKERLQAKELKRATLRAEQLTKQNQEARAKAIRERHTSSEVQGLNDTAELQLYGSGNRTYTRPDNDQEIVASPQNPYPGKLAKMLDDPKYGETRADREESVRGYQEELQQLADDGFELCQAKLIMDLREKAADKLTKNLKPVVDAKTVRGHKTNGTIDRAWAAYDEEDKQRLALIRDGGVFTRAEYAQVTNGEELYSRGKESSSAQKTPEQAALTELQVVWAEFEKSSILDLRESAENVRAACETYLASSQFSEEEKAAKRDNFERVIKDIESRRYTSEENKYPRSPDTSSEVNEEVALLVHRGVRTLDVDIKKIADKVYAADQAGETADMRLAKAQLDCYFKAYAQAANLSGADKQDRYNLIMEYVRTGKMPDGAIPAPQSAPGSGGEASSDDGEADDANKRSGLRNRREALKSAIINPSEKNNWLEAITGNEERKIFTKKRVFIGAAALVGAGVLLWASQKNGWGLDVIPIGDGDGMDLNPFNGNRQGGQGLDINPFDGDGVDLNVNDNVPGEVPTDPAAGDELLPVATPETAGNFTYPIDWAEANGMDLQDLHELSDKARAAGESVQWHGSGTKEWLEINGNSSTDFLVDTLNKFRS